MKKLLCKYLGHKWTKLYVDENICVCKRCETIKFKRMKEQSELEKEIKRLQLANRMKRILNALNWAWCVYKKPENFQNSMLILLDSMTKYIKETQELNHPTMTQLAIIYGDETHPILSLWCGIGYDATPLKRIEELVDENRKLKIEISNLLMNKIK